MPLVAILRVNFQREEVVSFCLYNRRKAIGVSQEMRFRLPSNNVSLSSYTFISGYKPSPICNLLSNVTY